VALVGEQESCNEVFGLGLVLVALLRSRHVGNVRPELRPRHTEPWDDLVPPGGVQVEPGWRSAPLHVEDERLFGSRLSLLK
jgi:hypothetical protein